MSEEGGKEPMTGTERLAQIANELAEPGKVLSYTIERIGITVSTSFPKGNPDIMVIRREHVDYLWKIARDAALAYRFRGDGFDKRMDDLGKALNVEDPQ